METSGIHAEYRIPASVPREAEHCLMAAQRVVLPVVVTTLTSQGSLGFVLLQPARLIFRGLVGVAVGVEKCVFLGW